MIWLHHAGVAGRERGMPPLREVLRDEAYLSRKEAAARVNKADLTHSETWFLYK